MADNVEITKGAGTTVATDEVEIAGKKVQVQRIKPVVGVDGAATDVSSSSPMPVTDAGVGATTDAEATGNGSLIGLLKRLRKLQEGIAHDALDSGGSIKLGGRVRTVLAAAVSQDDRADMMVDKFGRQLVTAIPLDQRLSATLNLTNTTAGQLLAALTNEAYVVTSIVVTNASASASTKVEILDGEAVRWKGQAVKEGGGFSVSDPNGLFIGTKSTALRAKCVTTAADVDVSVSVFKVPA